MENTNLDMKKSIKEFEDFLNKTIPILKENPSIDTCYPIDYESQLVRLSEKCKYNWENEKFSEGIEYLDNVQIYEHFLDVVKVLKLRYKIKEKMYIVWVGGVIINEHLSQIDAELLANEWKEKGYDDVVIEDQTKH